MKLTGAFFLVVFILSTGVAARACLAQSAAPAGAETPPEQSGKTASTAGANAGLTAIEQARAGLKAAEAAHPGNTAEVLDALDNLVTQLNESHGAPDESLVLSRREVSLAEAVTGPRSKESVAALDELAQALTAVGRLGEARPVAEKAMRIASETMPDTTDYIDAVDTVALVCDATGDNDCSLRLHRLSVAVARKIKIVTADDALELPGSLSNLSDALNRKGDHAGAITALEEALAIAHEKTPDDPHILIFENNLGSSYSQNGQQEEAIPHLVKSIELSTAIYGANSAMVLNTKGNLAVLYGRAGHFDLSWKLFDEVLARTKPYGFSASHEHSTYARSLASGGSLAPAIREGLIAARMGRENFVLGARTLPERQAMGFNDLRARGLDLSMSVLAKHPQMISGEVYQEVIRSRALVADEMARRQKNLNRSNDPELGRLLKELDQARSALLALEQKGNATPEAIAKARETTEQAEGAVALRSAVFRSDERVSSVVLDDVRRNMPQGSVLISYVNFGRSAVEKVDAKSDKIPAFAVIVFHPDSGKLRIFDLGNGLEINQMVTSARATVDTEMQSGALGGKRNERAYREAAGALRARVWDPLQSEIAGAKLLLVVPDGMLNLIPFAALPDGDGYLLDHSAVIHTLSSERDLIPQEGSANKTGLAAVGNPEFNHAVPGQQLSALQPGLESGTTRSAGPACDVLSQVKFHPLPESAVEVRDITAQWQAANRSDTAAELLGAEATRDGFLREAVHARVLHIATHAYVVSQDCGDGNPLLHSGLVFAGANTSRETSVLTAQQIASLDLSGVDWAVLSACNTGNGPLQSGEGVLGLQRAFRVAGARSVIMTLWPVDDEMSRRYMHELYAQRFGHGATTADSIWNASQKLLADRRAAGLSTHPWYWAGFVGSGSWE